MVERGPEKAGVGGSIPSLATTQNQPLTRLTQKVPGEPEACKGCGKYIIFSEMLVSGASGRKKGGVARSWLLSVALNST